MEKSERLSSFIEGLCFILMAAAFAGIQIMIAGTRMVFSLPFYGLLGVLGLLAVLSLRRPKPVPSSWCLPVTALFMGYILVRACFHPSPISRAATFTPSSRVS